MDHLRMMKNIYIVIKYISLGDSHGLSLIGKHEIAEKMRSMGRKNSSFKRVELFLKRMLNI